jgi:hypothetical protein
MMIQKRGNAARQRAFLPWLALLVSSAAHPAVVRVTASGTVADTVVDAAGLLPFDAPASGTTLTLTFTFDDSVPDQIGGGNTARYVDGVSPLQLLVGTTAYSLPSGTASIFIGNDWASIVGIPPVVPQQYDDTWQLLQSAFRPEGTIEESLALSFFNGSTTLPVAPLDSTVLVAPPPPSGWSFAGLSFRVEDTAAGRPGRVVAVAADITDLTVTPVPVPAVLPLLLSSLLLGGAVFRSRSAA